jgi:hypothetical protein
MRCLSDAELQAYADHEAGEAGGELAAHVAGCQTCRQRVDEIRDRVATIAAVVDSAGDLPPRLEARVRDSIASHRPVRGSTRVRAPFASPVWSRPAFISGLAIVAAVTVVVFGILPRFGAPTTLSASQVLGRSLETLSSATGIEVLEYELVADGIARGSWRIHLVIDHERPTRYRATTLGPDGEILAAISQDPVRQRRAQLVRVDGRNYVVRVTPVPNPMLSLPQMAQALAETAITMMQATSDQKLTVVEGPEGRRYVIEIPPVTATNAAATLDLQRARTVVGGTDFRIHEFEAAGTLLKQPFSISFRLIQHMTLGGMTPDPFELQAGPEDVVLEGVATDHPFDELLTTIVRELARSRTF